MKQSSNEKKFEKARLSLEKTPKPSDYQKLDNNQKKLY